MNLNLKIQIDQPKKIINIEMYESTHAQLKECAARAGTTMQNLVIHSINNTIDELTGGS